MFGACVTEKKSPAARREEILGAALACINRNGYHATSVDDIAAAIGISKGAIYYHFASKKALLIELYRSRVNRYFDMVTASMQDCKNPADQLRFLLKRSEEVFDDHIPVLHFLLECVAMGARDRDIRRELTVTYHDRIERFRGLIQDGIDGGTFRDMAAVDAARLFYFLSMGFFLTCFTVDIDFDPVAIHQKNVETILQGVFRHNTSHQKPHKRQRRPL
jgi:AcrR family transcriptional regulator